MITHQNGPPKRRIGVESSHGFGDCLFNVPLLKAISEQFKTPVGVATKPQNTDAFKNLPWVDEVITISSMGDGEQLFKNRGYQKTYQATQNIWFFEFRKINPHLSLIDTAAMVGNHFGINEFNRRPIFLPTDSEKNAQAQIGDGPIIAVESVYNSAQSWATEDDFNYIVETYGKTHKILWLSHKGHPPHPNLIPTQHMTRRQLIMCLQRADMFFSVGSGFFCSMLSLPPHQQPKRTICLWVDNLYLYEARLREVNWCSTITWVHNQAELRGLK